MKHSDSATMNRGQLPWHTCALSGINTGTIYLDSRQPSFCGASNLEGTQ